MGWFCAVFRRVSGNWNSEIKIKRRSFLATDNTAEHCTHHRSQDQDSSTTDRSLQITSINQQKLFQLNDTVACSKLPSGTYSKIVGNTNNNPRTRAPSGRPVEAGKITTTRTLPSQVSLNVTSSLRITSVSWDLIFASELPYMWVWLRVQDAKIQAILLESVWNRFLVSARNKYLTIHKILLIRYMYVPYATWIN